MRDKEANERLWRLAFERLERAEREPTLEHLESLADVEYDLTLDTQATDRLARAVINRVPEDERKEVRKRFLT